LQEVRELPEEKKEMEEKLKEGKTNKWKNEMDRDNDKGTSQPYDCRMRYV